MAPGVRGEEEVIVREDVECGGAGELAARTAAHDSARRTEARLLPAAAVATVATRNTQLLSPEMKATASARARVRMRPAMSLSQSQEAEGFWRRGVYLPSKMESLFPRAKNNANG
jgi:hypothetical protein